MPKVSSIVFADHIIVDTDGKRSLIGIFTKVIGHSEPVVVKPWGIYFSISDVFGKHTFSLDLTHMKTSKQLLKIEGVLEVKDEINKNAEFSYMIPAQMAFPYIGVYSARVLLDSTFLGSNELIVELIRQ